MLVLRKRLGWAMAIGLLAAGCGSIDAAGTSLGASPTVDLPDAGTGDAGNGMAQKKPQPPNEDSGGGAADAGGLPTPLAGANPLCQATTSTCDPDLPACYVLPYGATLDGGAGDADDGAALPDSGWGGGLCNVAGAGSCSMGSVPAACRAGKLGPFCGLNYGKGQQGDACKSSLDCDIGFECTASASGAGVCKKYCCSGICPKDPTAPTSTVVFCDVETALDGERVPVCTGSTACTPLDGSNNCPSDTTCTIVDDSGQTACQTPGNAGEGDSCQVDNCKAGLGCINGFCRTLCNPGSYDGCPAGETCSRPSGLHDATSSVGVCM